MSHDVEIHHHSQQTRNLMAKFMRIHDNRCAKTYMIQKYVCAAGNPGWPCSCHTFSLWY